MTNVFVQCEVEESEVGLCVDVSHLSHRQSAHLSTHNPNTVYKRPNQTHMEKKAQPHTHAFTSAYNSLLYHIMQPVFGVWKFPANMFGEGGELHGTYLS